VTGVQGAGERVPCGPAGRDHRGRALSVAKKSRPAATSVDLRELPCHLYRVLEDEEQSRKGR